MKTRIVLGSVMIAGVVVLLWGDCHLQQVGFEPVGVPVGALTALLVAVGYLELVRISKAAGGAMDRPFGLLCAVALASWPVWRQLLGHQDGFPPGDRLLLGFGAILIVLFLGQMARFRTAQAVRRLAGSLFGVIYLGGLSACILALRVRFGIGAMVLFLVAAKFTDMGAYFTGARFGRHKLIRWLSPGKSWEGLAGGLAAAAGGSMLFAWLCGIIITIWQAAVFGIAVGAAGQFGDLCESLLKRDAGLKDSGGVVPGFGGILDIVDSLVISAPVAYALLAAWVGSLT